MKKKTFSVCGYNISNMEDQIAVVCGQDMNYPNVSFICMNNVHVNKVQKYRSLFMSQSKENDKVEHNCIFITPNYDLISCNVTFYLTL